MSAVTRIGTVIVPVADQDRALEFYVGTLGFEVRLDTPFGPGMRWIEVAPPGAETTLALVARRRGRGELRDDRRRGRPRRAAGRGRRRRPGAHPHRRGRAADVHAPRPRRQPPPRGGAGLRWWAAPRTRATARSRTSSGATSPSAARSAPPAPSTSDGRKVVDLWGGYRDGAHPQAVAAGHTGPVFSTTKGVCGAGDRARPLPRPARLRRAGGRLLAGVRRRRQGAT